MKALVTVSARMKDEQEILSVSDDADSLDEKDLSHLFERCYKGIRHVVYHASFPTAMAAETPTPAANDEDG